MEDTVENTKETQPSLSVQILFVFFEKFLRISLYKT